MVIVDTTVWIDYLRGKATREADWLDREISRQRLGLLDIILCEVLQGVSDPRLFEDLRRQLLSFEVFAAGGADHAILAARNFQRLRALGFTVRRTIDCWIATFCLLHGHDLLHNDRDFGPFEKHLGLRVVRP